ncbi:MAG TPA: LysR family transcriptional regulator [Burkholderiales bacterium]|jgi:DNA-binding transcriptional LysR family regulator|nr:LysR family transcriptional regulator [Burkholderiales bacterium]
MSRTHPRRFFRHGLLPQLLVFEAVARLGSVTRAAGELHLAQPTVSLQLKKLAATLEVTLFEQQGRSLRLTGAGHTLHETCGELIHCLIRADAKLAAFRQAKAERLRLAVEPEVRAAAARLIAGFCARHPGVQATLHVGEREELLERLAAGADDLYFFVLEIEGLPAHRRWSIAHPKGRAPSEVGALFLREAVLGAVPGIEGVAQPVAEQVERKDQQED